MSKDQLKTLSALLVLLFSSASMAGSPSECNSALLNHIPGSYLSYVQKAEERRGDSATKHPEFLNPQREMELAKLWKGEPAPELLAPFLPEGVTFVGHSLKKASAPGVVKVEQPGGDFLILRVEMPFKGRIIATNVTVNAQALYSNLARYRDGSRRWLIGPDATAALDWGHGGGTKTTGGHTADTLMNYMAKNNIFTIGADQSWHGEGPREWFEDDTEYFEFRAAFRHRFIHPDVPTFMIGHSYGGLIGDMAVRRSGKGFENLALKKAYAGIIPLSFVADPSPGSDFEGKMLKERITDAERKWAENEARVNEGDLDLFANLMAADKCSALSGLQCSQISLYNNWKMDDNILPKPFYLDEVPSTAGSNSKEGFRQVFQDFLESHPKDLADGPIPSLYYMGEHDALYVLHEDNIETYVRRLKNSILWTVSARVTFRGKVEKVGHMVFDHYIPKKDHPEAVDVLRTYLKSKNAERPVPADEKALQELFKYEVLKGKVNPYTYLTPVNNYSSTLVLMAYLWVPDFKPFLEERIERLAAAKSKDVRSFMPDYFIGYSEKEVFETYQVIRDFVAGVLKHKGIEVREIAPKQRIQLALEAGDVLAHSREAILSVLKAHGNNLAFREFLDDLKYMDIVGTSLLQDLNAVGMDLTTRIRLVESIKKSKLSEEEKLVEFDKLGPIADGFGVNLNPRDFDKMQATLERIHLIRNKKYVPNDENRQYVEENIARRNEIQVELKTTEKTRDGVKKQIKEMSDLAKKQENQLNRLTDTLSSPTLDALEAKRQSLYNDLETYDFKQRDIMEAHMVKILNTKASWRESFTTLPDDLQKLFVDTEKASQTYQAVLKEIEATKTSEALAGNLGPEAKALAEELYGDRGLNARIAAASRTVDELEYIEMARLKDENDQLTADYVERIMPEYFQVQWVQVKDVLAQPNDSDESFREHFKALEKGLSLWRARVLVSKPSAEASSLY